MGTDKNGQNNKKTRQEYAEDALYREVWEDVNNEKTQQFIKKYYRHMLAAALVLLILVTGINIGIHHHNANKLSVAINYETALENTDATGLENLAKHSSGATSDLSLFQSYLLDKDVKKLEQLATHGNTRDFRDLAKIHLANINGDKMSGADMEKYLSDLDTKNSPYYYSSRLLIAQKYISENNQESANKFLDVIINDEHAPSSISAVAATLR